MTKFHISDEDFQAAWDSLEDEAPITKIVMRDHLIVLRSRTGMREKEFAKRELATYFKEKPVSKKEIKVEDGHDDWVNEVEEALDGKDDCQKTH